MKKKYGKWINIEELCISTFAEGCLEIKKLASNLAKNISDDMPVKEYKKAYEILKEADDFAMDGKSLIKKLILDKHRHSLSKYDSFELSKDFKSVRGFDDPAKEVDLLSDKSMQDKIVSGEIWLEVAQNPKLRKRLVKFMCKSFRKDEPETAKSFRPKELETRANEFIDNAVKDTLEKDSTKARA